MCCATLVEVINIPAKLLDLGCYYVGRSLFSITLPRKTESVCKIQNVFITFDLELAPLAPQEKFSANKHLFWKVSRDGSCSRFRFEEITTWDDHHTNEQARQKDCKRKLEVIAKPFFDRFSGRINHAKLKERLTEIFQNTIGLHVSEGIIPALRWKPKYPVVNARDWPRTISEDVYQVCLVCAPDSNHAEIVIEGLEYDRKEKDMLQFLILVHLTNSKNVVKLCINSLDPKKFDCSRVSRKVWQVEKCRVEKLLKKVEEEGRSNQVSYSLTGLFGENCFTWAKKRLSEDLGIELEQTSLGLPIHPNTYTDEKPSCCLL